MSDLSDVFDDLPIEDDYERILIHHVSHTTEDIVQNANIPTVASNFSSDRLAWNISLAWFSP